jgi:Mg-chelatase subunit ChlD
MRLRGYALSLVVSLVLAGTLIHATDDRVRAQDAAVDLAIVLAIDCSYSVDMAEYHLQVTGMAEAFRQPEIHNAIASGPLGRIAVSVVQWSDMEHQSLVVPWTIVSDAASGEALAVAMETLPRTLAEGGTSLAHAMRFSAQLLAQAPVQAERYVIDIAADGRNNNGGDPRPMRDAILESGITINGLAILNEVPTLDRYFERYITGGPGNFVMVANDYSSYSAAIYRKLLREIFGPRMS